jgi:hypothetical protein
MDSDEIMEIILGSAYKETGSTMYAMSLVVRCVPALTQEATTPAISWYVPR